MAETEINVRFKVNDDGSVVLDKIGKGMQRIQDNVESANKSLGLISGASLLYLGEKAIQAAGQMYRLAESTANFGGEIERNSVALGMNTSQYQQWTYVAKSADVELDQFLKGIRGLTNVMSESPIKIERFGISTKNAAGELKNVDEILPELITRLSKIGNTTELNAAAMDIFGARSGMAFATMIREGKNIDEITRHFKDMNLEISESTIKKLAESEQAFKDLAFAGQKLKASLHPVITELARDAEWWASAIGMVVDKFETMQDKAATKELLNLKQQLAFSKTPEAGAFGMGDLETQQSLEKRIKELQEGWKVSGKAPGGGMGPDPQSVEAAKELSKALQKAAEAESELNSFYADDVQKLKTLNLLAEQRTKALDIMSELGVKTTKGAEAEIEAVQKKYKTLMGQGYSPEEMEQARVKLEEQLKAVETKYKTESGWKRTGEEGGVQWWSNVVPKEGVGANITDMVKKGIDELNRMKQAAESITGPKTMMIDYTQVQSAGEMVDQLRGKLAQLGNEPIVITIKQRIESENPIVVSQVEDALVTRLENKQSRLGSIIRKEVEGVSYYSNE